MPAATTTTTTIAPEPPQRELWYRPTGEKVMEPFSSSITAAEHKIRNLEKRKQKLDGYRTEQAEGKTLNSDQLAAVAKYNEVIQQLEHNKELVNCLRQVHQQTIKFIKQELRRENLERNKFFLSLQAVMDQWQVPKVQHDFQGGINFATKMNKEDVMELSELSKLLKPSLREPEFASKVEVGAEIVSKLYESRGKINNRSSQQVKTLVESVVESKYWSIYTSGPDSSVPIDSVVEDVAPRSQEAHIPVHLPEVPMGNNNPVSAQMSITQDLTYSFIQESRIEESPCMDPAVVAFAPSQPQIQSHPENNQVLQLASSGEGLNSIQTGVRDMNLNHVNSNNVDEEQEEWASGKIPPSAYNNSSSVNGNMESVIADQDNMNGFDRSGRGNSRGRNGRNLRRGNGGYASGKSPRGGSRGGFRNNFARGQSDAETAEFRGKGGRGGYSRPFRGNGSAPMPTGASSRRGGRVGANKPYNGSHEPRSME